MSSSSSPSPSPSPAARPTIPSSKSSVAPSKSTPHEVTGVEMKSMATDRDAASSTTAMGMVGSGPMQVPIGEDIMQLARLGEVATMQKLFDAKKFDANYKDEEGITPLHWAAINNQYSMCKFLLDAGADVNAKGGESVATPAMWAAQRCHYYIVNLLLQHGADPLVTDVQGYNILHLATIDGNAFLLVLLLHQEIPVDVVDQQGHTGLMWAAYKGYPTCVDLFLRWGANVNAADEGGLTPLHWALVKGSVPCIQKLLEYGADRYTKTRDGKTPSTVSTEMNTSRQWYRALDECGYNMDGSTKIHPFGLTNFVRNKSVLSKFFFLWPFLMVFVGIYILSYMPVFAAVPIGVVVVFALQWVAQQVANRGPSDYRVLQKTPFLSGVFAASLFWTAVTYVLKVLPATYSSFPILNLFFSIFCALTFYFYTLSMVEDPGYIPKLVSKNQQKTVISQLFDLWKFDEENFCVYCMIRKPLRSKHCRRCNRCVAKHDHHCPWIDNCVGANNLRHFVLYIISLEVGIVLFVQLVINYIQLLPELVGPSCNIINDTLCSYMVRDTFTIVLAFWDSLQLIWVTMLCAVQLVQVARNQTTYENMRGHHIEKAPQSTQAFAAALAAGASNLDAAGLSGAGRGPNPAITGSAASQPTPRQHHRRRGFLGQWTTLLGIDAFFATARDGLRDGPASVVSRPRNPYSRGIITNCRDFWCDPAPIFGKREPGSGMIGGEIVSYYRMYETPLRMHRGGGGGSRGGSGGAYTSLANDDPEAGY